MLHLCTFYKEEHGEPVLLATLCGLLGQIIQHLSSLSLAHLARQDLCHTEHLLGHVPVIIIIITTNIIVIVFVIFIITCSKGYFDFCLSRVNNIASIVIVIIFCSQGCFDFSVSRGQVRNWHWDTWPFGCGHVPSQGGQPHGWGNDAAG